MIWPPPKAALPDKTCSKTLVATLPTNSLQNRHPIPRGPCWAGLIAVAILI